MGSFLILLLAGPDYLSHWLLIKPFIISQREMTPLLKAIKKGKKEPKAQTTGTVLRQNRISSGKVEKHSLLYMYREAPLSHI